MFSSTLASSLFIPPALSAFSVVYLGTKFWISRPIRSAVVNGKLPSIAGSSNGRLSGSSSRTKYSTLSETIQDFDGASIIAFRVLRLLVIAALLSLQVFDIASKDGHSTSYFQLVFLVSGLISCKIIVINKVCSAFDVDIHVYPGPAHHFRQSPAMEGHNVPTVGPVVVRRVLDLQLLGRMAICYTVIPAV